MKYYWRSEDGTWVERTLIERGPLFVSLNSGVYLDGECPNHSLRVAVGRFSFIIGISW